MNVIPVRLCVCGCAEHQLTAIFRPGGCVTPAKEIHFHLELISFVGELLNGVAERSSTLDRSHQFLSICLKLEVLTAAFVCFRGGSAETRLYTGNRDTEQGREDMKREMGARRDLLFTFYFTLL